MPSKIGTRVVHHEIPENQQINITPLIDVVFQLLIFFMLASSLIKPNMIELDLPESTTGVKNQEPDVIAVTYRLRDGVPEITVNITPVSDLEGLRLAMQDLRQPGDETRPRVDIQIDRTVPYQDVISVMDAVRDAGFPRFSLQTLAPTGIPRQSS